MKKLIQILGSRKSDLQIQGFDTLKRNDVEIPQTVRKVFIIETKNIEENFLNERSDKIVEVCIDKNLENLGDYALCRSHLTFGELGVVEKTIEKVTLPYSATVGKGLHGVFDLNIMFNNRIVKIDGRKNLNYDYINGQNGLVVYLPNEGRVVMADEQGNSKIVPISALIRQTKEQKDLPFVMPQEWIKSYRKLREEVRLKEQQKIQEQIRIRYELDQEREAKEIKRTVKSRRTRKTQRQIER